MSKKNGSNVSKQGELDQIIDDIYKRSLSCSDMCYLGQLLVRAEKIVGHGELNKRIKDNWFDFNYQEAMKYMKVYKKAISSLT